MKSLEKKRHDDYVVVDIETTGLSKKRHKITEIAAARVVDGKVLEEFQSLVNPRVHIPSFITGLTGIDDDLVEHEPPIQEVLPRFLDFLGSGVMVAHNATFDYGFLSHNAALLEHEMVNNRLCTRKLAYRLLPNISSRNLGAVCAYFGIDNECAHRAMGDVRATTEVFLNFLDILHKTGHTDAESIQKFESLQPRKCWDILREASDDIQ